MDWTDLQKHVDQAFDQRELLEKTDFKSAVLETIKLLDQGKIRVAEKVSGEWQVNEWVKKAVLLFFPVAEMQVHEIGPFEFYDKIPLKKGYKEAGVRVVPPGVARYGSFLERNVVLMPGYVNIGARVGEGTMVDTHVNVGSCAQIGHHVHLAGAVRIGGVLEPPQARPVIIEDHVFLGSQVSIMEGVIVEEESVLGSGVAITASSRIIDVTGSEPVVHRGRVPARSVVIPGAYEKEFPAGKYSVQCALIVGQRAASTDKKVTLNETLREFNISAA